MPGNVPEIDPEIAARYARIHEAGRVALQTGAYALDPPPVDGDPRWGLSAVLCPGGQVADTLAGEAAALRPFVGERQVVYADDSLHVTLRSIEFHRTDVGIADPRAAAYAEVR